MSKIKNYLMDELESGHLEYNPASNTYTPVLPIKVERVTDEELAGQSLIDAMERLEALLKRHKQLTRGSK